MGWGVLLLNPNEKEQEMKRNIPFENERVNCIAQAAKKGKERWPYDGIGWMIGRRNKMKRKSDRQANKQEGEWNRKGEWNSAEKKEQKQIQKK